VRYVFPSLCLHGITVKSRTSAAKAAPAQYIYGTAEAVPFVQSVFPPGDREEAQGLKPSSGALNGPTKVVP
jgi:hypothetical protein